MIGRRDRAQTLVIFPVFLIYYFFSPVWILVILKCPNHIFFFFFSFGFSQKARMYYNDRTVLALNQICPPPPPFFCGGGERVFLVLYLIFLIKFIIFSHLSFQIRIIQISYIKVSFVISQEARTYL